MKSLGVSRKSPPGPPLAGCRVRFLLLSVILASSLVASPSRSEEAGPAVSGGRAGRLEGSVAVGPELSARRMRFNLYPDPTQPSVPPPAFSPSDELQNVVIYLEAVDPPRPNLAPGTGPQVLRQQGRAFVPHVLPIQRGTSVEFPNQDPIYHNVFSLSESATFDLGRYPRGTSRSIRFDTPGIVKVFCHLHSDMSAIILVLDNSWFAAPDSGGRYAIPEIPPGDYRVAAFHERARRISRKVRIVAGHTAKIDFTIPILDPTDGG